MRNEEYGAGRTHGSVSEPPFVPVHTKPAVPGVSLNTDNSVAVYVRVKRGDSFESAARRLFAAMREACEHYPTQPRVLYVDIEGHEGTQHGFDADFFEFQQEFVFATVAPYLTAMSMPLLSVVNPRPQRDDLPERLSIHS